MVDIASSNTERLTLMINNLLDMDKISNGKMIFTFNQYNLMDMVDEAIVLNHSYADMYGVTFNIAQRFDAAGVMVDKDRFMQVLANFLSNAANFSHKYSSVDIYIEPNDDLVRVSIQDYGIEIDKEYHNEIFTKFSQTDSSDTRSKGGTGLGLAITKVLIAKFRVM